MQHIITAARDPAAARSAARRRSAVLGLGLALAVGVQAAPQIRFEPSFESVAIGREFEVAVSGLGFDASGNGTPIDNVTGGQNLKFTFSNAALQVLGVTIDPRWNFAASNRPGRVDQVAGTVTGVSFGAFPATTDDSFAIAVIALRAIAPGSGSITLDSGQFVGRVGGRSGQLIATSSIPALVTVTAVPEPDTWALLVSGLCLVALKRRRASGTAAD